VIAYKGSRGCPYNCSFCYNNKFNESRWRSWSDNIVVEDIKYLKEKHNIDAVVFYDDNFFANHARAWKILQAIDLPSHVEIRIDHITDDVARQLSENKCFTVSIGVESGSDRILEIINKKYKVPRIFEAIRNLAKYNVAACYSAIVGLPTETKEEFQSTIKLFYDLYKIHPRANFTLGAYMPYPGTGMYNFALENGFKPPQKTEDWKNIDRFREEYDTPWVNGRLVYRIREYFKFLTWKLGPLHNWFEFRIKKQFFALPFDIPLMEWFAGFIIEEKNWLSRWLRKLYRSYKYGQ
jgi:anaerobic magnesium-protoporphyrin IX monomethyl ester cyclase